MHNHQKGTTAGSVLGISDGLVLVAALSPLAVGSPTIDVCVEVVGVEDEAQHGLHELSARGHVISRVVLMFHGSVEPVVELLLHGLRQEGYHLLGVARLYRPICLGDDVPQSRPAGLRPVYGAPSPSLCRRTAVS